MARMFLYVLNLSLVGSWVILLVLLVRLLLRRSPRWCSYVLWGVVFLRLVLPVVPETGFSLVPAGVQELTDTMEEFFVEAAVQDDILKDDILQDHKLAGEVGFGQQSFGAGSKSEGSDNVGIVSGNVGDVIHTGTQEDTPGADTNGSYVGNEDTVNPAASNTLLHILAGIWIVGAIGFGTYHVASYQKFKKQMKSAMQVEEHIYEIQSEHLSFVAGNFKPAIYLSKALDKESRKVVLCHEQVHLKRRDYLIKPAALAITCIHWFNPLVWLAFRLMNVDCEMSCDEKVVSILGEESKKIYSFALLDEATRGARKVGRRDNVCAVLSFGEDSIKNRIRHVLQFKKAPFWLIGGSVVVLVILVAGILSERGEEEKSVESYTGAFEAAVDLEDEVYTFAPKGNVEYGMSMKEILRAENLKRSAMKEEEPNIVVVTKTLTGVSESIEEVALTKKYVVREGFGLAEVEYIYTMADEEWEKFTRVLAGEAEEYMPELNGKNLFDRMWFDGYVKWEDKNYKETELDTYVEFANLLFGENPTDREQGMVELTIRIGIEYGDIAELLNYQPDERIKDINLFEYVVNLEDEEYAYSPAQVEYGMGPEEVIQALNLDEGVTAVGFEEKDEEFYSAYTRETFQHVFPNTEEMVFSRSFTFSKEEGLHSVSYSLTVDKDDFDKVIAIIYDQAVEYMPELSTLKSIKFGTGTSWIESKVIDTFNWVNGVEVRDDGQSLGQNSEVRISVANLVDGTEKSKITVQVWHMTDAQREALLGRNRQGTATEDKLTKYLPALGWPEYTMEEATSEALTIIHGKVIEKLKTHDGTDIWQEVIVEVQEVLKGEENDKLVLYQEPGGENETTVYEYEDVEKLNVGEEYIFFTMNPLGVYENPKLVLPYSDANMALVKALLDGTAHTVRFDYKYLDKNYPIYFIWCEKDGKKYARKPEITVSLDESWFCFSLENSNIVKLDLYYEKFRFGYVILYDLQTDIVLDILEGVPEEQKAVINNILLAEDLQSAIIHCNKNEEVYFYHIPSKELVRLTDMTGLTGEVSGVYLDDDLLLLNSREGTSSSDYTVELYTYNLNTKELKMVVERMPLYSPNYQQEGIELRGVKNPRIYKGKEVYEVNVLTGERKKMEE